MTHFRANGKLLLTAEYTVLRGALALALPTRLGQTLEVSPFSQEVLLWQSKELDGSIWFEATFASDLNIVEATDRATAEALGSILKTAIALNPEFNPIRQAAVTTAEFNRAWGLGSSSTLVALIAQWANVDALKLFFRTQTGSGYDVAAALSKSPLLYQITGEQEATVQYTQYHPDFANELAFVYLGQKQKSDREVARFSSKTVSDYQLEAISSISQSIADCKQLYDFENLLSKHEALTGEVLDQIPVQQRLFNDYTGVVKSLGAWGGDFVLATRLEVAKAYFPQKGYTTILGWQDLFDF